jgi:short-subunit dehydrogenase
MNIIIIGATSGIGRALFKKYAADDNRIGIVGRRTHLLNELRQEHLDTAITVMADITKQDEIAKAIDALHSELKDIDLAIVCSGVGNINASLDYAVERPTIDTNVTGWTFVVDTLYNIFEQQGHGHLVAITSAGGLRGEPMAPAYSASKAYQINYMEALRKKGYKSGNHIHITDIRPGLVNTAMAKGEGLFCVMPVEKVASQIIITIRKQMSKVYVTKRWHILAIINKNLPYALYKRL